MFEMINRAIQLSNEGRLDESIKLFKDVLAVEAMEPNANYNIGLVYIKKEEYENALVHLKKSLRMIKNPDTLKEIGVCYIRLHKLDEALEYLETAIDLADTSEINNTTGVVWFQKSDYNKARE